jgi:hypothetical protein
MIYDALEIGAGALAATLGVVLVATGDIGKAAHLESTRELSRFVGGAAVTALGVDRMIKGGSHLVEDYKAS